MHFRRFGCDARSSASVVYYNFTYSVVVYRFLKNKTVNKALNGVKPVVVGLIIGTAVNMAYKTLSLKPFDFISLGIMIAVAIACLVYKKIRKKALSPIIVILGAAVLGMLFYSL